MKNDPCPSICTADTFRAIYGAAFHAWLKGRGYTDSTVHSYSLAAWSFLDWLALQGFELADLDDAVVRRFRDNYRKRPSRTKRESCAKNTRNRTCYPIIGANHLMKFLEDHGIVRHPGEGVIASRLLEDFKRALLVDGYREFTVVCKHGAARHFLIWLHRTRTSLREVTPEIVKQFLEHECLCSGHGNSKVKFSPSHYFVTNINSFAKFLAESGTSPNAIRVSDRLHGPECAPFRAWLRDHRDLKEKTIDERVRIILALLPALGNDPRRYSADLVREALLAATVGYSAGSVRNVASTLRLYLRFLASTGACRPSLVGAVMTGRQWRLATLPRYVSKKAVERVISSVELDSSVGRRDRAILLLLARLGLRAIDVQNLRFDDIDWKNATIQVSAKSDRAVRLPLPQDVGDALLQYIEKARPRVSSTLVFLCARAPFGAFRTSRSVSQIAIRAMKRAGVKSPAGTGSHVFRHSVATNLLRAGTPMEAIGALLRHRSLDTTAIYAKVDFPMLQEISQTWIGGRQ